MRKGTVKIYTKSTCKRIVKFGYHQPDSDNGDLDVSFYNVNFLTSKTVSGNIIFFEIWTCKVFSWLLVYMVGVNEQKYERKKQLVVCKYYVCLEVQLFDLNTVFSCKSKTKCKTGR